MAESEFENLFKQDDQEALSIIKRLSDKELIDSKGNHILHIAAKNKNLFIINYFVAFNYDLAVKDALDKTPLMIAVEHKNFEIAKTLHAYHLESLRMQLNFFIGHDWKSRLEVQSIRDLVSNVWGNKWSSEEIGEMLAKINCTIYNVVIFNDPFMTKAYLETIPPIDDDSIDFYRVFHIIGKKYDLNHILVILKNAPIDPGILLDYFSSYIINHVCNGYESILRKSILKSFCGSNNDCNSKRTFLHRIFSGDEIFNKESLVHLEKELKRTPANSIKTFLKYNLHSVVKAKHGRDLMACLFGNRELQILSVVKEDQIDVDGRGHSNRTPLHFAAEENLVDNVRMLVNRGADPNALDDNGNTPLALALFSKNCDKRSIKLLLQAGGDPLLISSKLEEVLAREDINFPNLYGAAKHAIAQLVIYEMIGLYNEETSKLFEPWYNLESESFINKCKQQLTDLLDHKIRNGPKIITMFTIIAKKSEQLSYQFDDKEMQVISTFAESDQRKTLNSYYRYLLRKRAQDIVEIDSCRKIAIQSVCQFIGINDPQHLIIEKIVGYLSLKDLWNISISEKENLSLITKMKNLLRLENIFEFTIYAALCIKLFASLV